ncbi:TetR/AcrR family transcriptional regulator [Streptomyces vinaceus]|uniref:TetR/AcrR family transcriptional regulator n=1 Tax=Streptomyces vinaceus TaxID=1960 RepID=A0A5J6JFU7_STRVI|nr:TetR/AcrR family transcriptional regulator [Streptomyces vinaceus]QEV49435.1 TetR/AcrR family transcriptional regulator [Streptomyces vinaceus]GHE45466.1 TetR family transcriptional regulator [Streptomyces vinaceus]
MSEPTATTTPRERYRRQVREEIKQRAREQIAAAGTSALSLNKIAKQMGLSGAGLYRYFTGRDELLAELVRDAYQSLVDAFRAAAGRDEGGLHGLAHALRAWALDDPQRYFLVYGPPVPGYRAPVDLSLKMAEIMSLIISASDADPASSPGASPPASLSAGEDRAPASSTRLALAFWTRLHGILSLELSGHFLGMGFDPAQLYENELDLLSAG